MMMMGAINKGDEEFGGYHHITFITHTETHRMR